MMIGDPRENVMPLAADALRLGETAPKRSRGRFLGALLLSVLVVLVLSFVAHHIMNYSYGRDTMGAWMAQNQTVWAIMGTAQQNASHPPPPSVSPSLNVTYGALMMGAVALSRLMFVGSPFHPIGLLVLNSVGVNGAWFSVMVAWALKKVILRFGGASLFTRLRPLFIGMIVGAALVSMLWVIVGYFVHWPGGGTYWVLPG
jgi:hypothetical protein